MRLPRKHRRPSPGAARRPGLAAGLAAALLLPCACRGAPVPRAPVRGEPSATVPSPASVPGTPQAARFRALQAALEEGEDELAQQLLAVLRGQPLAPLERELLASAERVLAGRALVRGLELALASEPVDGQEGAFRLVLLARSASAVRLALPPCDLVHRRASIDARGLESIEAGSKACHALADLELPGGLQLRVELASYELPLGRALAVRERWRLDTRSGEIESAGERYPAAGVSVAGCERERLSPLIGSQPAAPRALAERLGAAEAARGRELLELALRIPPPEREQALAELAPVVARLARAAPERVQTAEPALRWLSGNRELGPDAEAWARFLEARSRPGPAPADPAGDGLDLPGRPRAARRAQEGGAR